MNNAQELIRHGDQLFGKRLGLLSLWQEIADNFYVERAGFTASRSLGADFASGLVTSYPLLARRDLGNAFSAMLRPAGQEWFHIRLDREEREDQAGRRWLEWATGLQRRAMYDRVTHFIRATKQGDHDFAAFGQCVLSVELNRTASALLYRCWHLRDVAWCETYDGRIGPVHRKWEPTVRDLATEFRGKLSPKVTARLDKEPYSTVRCRHAILPAEEYDAPSSKDDYEYVKPGVRKWKTPYVSIYLDVDHEHVLEQTGVYNPMYVIPRWQTVSGSQYAYSPATVAALPDARLIQTMTLTLLEAGEKAVNPPLIGVQEAVRSDVQVFAGGITWVDAEYDERLGAVLRPLTQDKSGIPLGMDMRQDIKEMIARAFYLDKIGLPQPMTKEMTAFEVSQRIQEYIREALPLFEPMEMDYNGALCDLTFDILLRAGAFGSPQDMPESLQGQEVKFRFESPLHEAAERQKGQAFLQSKQLLLEAAQLDPGVAHMFDARTALREAFTGVGTPAAWLRDEETTAALAEQDQQAQQAQQLMASVQAGAMTAEQVGKASQAFSA